ncbi:hypothetical protein Focb16_v005417 [Fusarium oxysporum f. sp. cubense]|uniref:NACHT domain-containing protein n=2 Tax=Fusarium oxysporum f. sp. cubense TaxID=61366 RepID=N4U899_FUSC1|nr:hypothetical protein FOC1_g10000301 [Fusarium oxysporum f. sp. cubense race 1]TVY74752.1 hypothetical protein Focb16_v005417 [Fusarium oxysporum f. sp. cubense]
MSGAEAALLGVDILCNAMQILTFAKDSIHVYRNIRDGRAPDPNLDSYLRNAKASFDEMNQTAAQMRPLTKEQQKIVDVGKQIHDCVDELQQQFSKLHVDDKSKRGFHGRLAASKKSATALWRGKELQGVESNLQRHEQLLQSLLLDRVCSQSQAAELTSLRSFQHVHGALQVIISRLGDSSAKVSELLTDLSSDVSNRLVEEHATSQKVIGDRIGSAEDSVLQSVSQSLDNLRRELLAREQVKSLEKQQEQLLSSLRFPEMNGRRNHISDNYPGTFAWIFDRHTSLHLNAISSSGSEQDDQVPEDTKSSEIGDRGSEISAANAKEPGFDCVSCWLESDLNLFWISGKPASGKSSLMKFLASNDLTMGQLKAWRTDIQILTHFFWKPGQLLQQTVKGMVLSLLHQVLTAMPSLCQKLYTTQPSTKHKASHSDWSLHELTETLVWVLEASPEDFCIFLDGLDEAKDLGNLLHPDWTHSGVIHKLLKLKNVKICASSREEHAFGSFFEDVSRLRIHLLNNPDITLFIRERLDICGLGCRDRDQLILKTVERAQGVFLWVTLVVDRLNRAIRQGYRTMEVLQQRLEQTPSDLNTLYTDMWSRAGDDGQLPNMKVAASLYFSLIIMARSLNDYLSEGCYFWSSSTYVYSLLTMAIATQDESLETILRTGRMVAVEDLLSMCSRVENEIQLVCHGLIEIKSTWEGDSIFDGDERLRTQNFSMVDFIHRSAFDFLVDTELGRECLNLCILSQSEQTSRLVAAHIIRARFFHLSEFARNGSRPIGLRYPYHGTVCDLYLSMAIALSINNLILTEESVRDGLLDVVRDWQLSKLFSGHIHWAMPTSFHPSSSYLELEFIEATVSVTLFNIHLGDCITDLESFLERYPVPIFIDAIPVILRSLTVFGWRMRCSSLSLELLKHTFRRLLRIANEEERYQSHVRVSMLALHSWYVIYCLADLSTSDTSDGPGKSFDIDFLVELSNTLIFTGDWQHVLLLEVQGNNRSKSFEVFQSLEGYRSFSRYALVAGDFAIAYRLLDSLLLRHFSLPLGIQIPHDVDSRFDIIFIADRNGKADPLSSVDANCYIPDARLRSQVQHLVLTELIQPMARRRESWLDTLRVSGEELGLINASDVFDYAMNKFSELGVQIILPGSLIGLTKVKERRGFSRPRPAKLSLSTSS